MLGRLRLRLLNPSRRPLARVHTLAVNMTNNISSIFRASDLDALINYMAKKARACLLAPPPDDKLLKITRPRRPVTARARARACAPAQAPS